MRLPIHSGGREASRAIAAQAPSSRWLRLRPSCTGPRPCSSLRTPRCSHRGIRRPFSLRVHSHSTGGLGSTAAGGSPRRRERTYDVVSLGNLCVDIVLPVDSLPPPDTSRFQCRSRNDACNLGLPVQCAAGNQQTRSACQEWRAHPALASFALSENRRQGQAVLLADLLRARSGLVLKPDICLLPAAQTAD